MAKKTAKKKTAKKKTAKKKAAPKRKAAARKPARKTKTAKKKSARKPNAAFMAPVTPSAVLSEVIGSKPMPRTEVTKKLWAYIKRNGLQDKKKSPPFYLINKQRPDARFTDTNRDRLVAANGLVVLNFSDDPEIHRDIFCLPHQNQGVCP